MKREIVMVFLVEMWKMVYNMDMLEMMKILGVCERTSRETSIEGQFNTIIIVFFVALVVIVGSLFILRNVLQWSPSKRKRNGNKSVIISAVISFLIIVAIIVVLSFWGNWFQDPLNC